MAATKRPAKPKPSAHKLRHPKKRAFLAAFAETASIRMAAAAAGIDRTAHYVWLRNDPDYAAAFEVANDQAGDALEVEARRRAVDGVEKAVYYHGEVVGTFREFSDTLLIVLLKARYPERYRERISVLTEDAIDAEIRKLAAELERRPAAEAREAATAEGSPG